MLTATSTAAAIPAAAPAAALESLGAAPVAPVIPGAGAGVVRLSPGTSGWSISETIVAAAVVAVAIGGTAARKVGRR